MASTVTATARRFVAAALVALPGLVACADDARERVAPAAAGDRPVRRERSVRPLSVEPRMPSSARVHEDREDRLRVKLPAGWHRAGDRATARISLVAGTVLVVGTARVSPRRGAACSDAPDEPRVELGPADALIVIEEDVLARPALAPDRPRFRLLEQVAPPGRPRRERTGVLPAWNCRNVVGISGLRTGPFADGGRVFTVTAIVGRSATRRTQGEVLAILNSLETLDG